jgi:ribonucleotide monophosphatase NagD (HAD superfamily)
MIDAALELRYGSKAPRFVKLGKPYTSIFDGALALAKNKNVVMIGDQTATDVKGANAAGIDCALIGTGIADIHNPHTFVTDRPTYRLENLSL